MKYCEEYAALLDLFADGELPTAEMERVRAHLEICPGCRGYVDDALAIRAGFPDAEDTAVPEGFVESVMERVREDAGKGAGSMELKRRAARRRAGTFAALAACCALVIFVRTGSGGLSGGGNSDSAAMSAAGGAGAPAGYAMDTDGAEAGNDAGIEFQMTEEPAAAPEEAKLEEGAEKIEGRSEAQMATAMDREAAVNSAETGGAEKEAVSDSEYEDLAVSPSAALPETSANVIYTAGGKEAALYLTAEEAGGLLDGYMPVRETVVVLDDALAGPERWYELTEEEYQSLLEALGRPAEAAAAPALVVVTGPFE